MNALRHCVLIVDDEAMIAQLWSIHMEMIGLDVCGVAATAEAAIALAQEHRPALVLMDVRLKGEADGIDAAIAIREQMDSKVIFISGSQEPSTLARMKLGSPSCVLFKPVSDRQLHAAVRNALDPAAA